MATKIVRLTESDLIRLVRKVVKEEFMDDDFGEALLSRGGIDTGKFAPNGMKKTYYINNGFYGWANEDGRLFTMEVPDDREDRGDIRDYFVANNYEENPMTPVHAYRLNGIMQVEFNKQ